MIGGELEQLFIKRVTIFGIIVLLRSLFISCNKIIEIDTPANAVPFLFPYKNKNLYIFFSSIGAVLEDFYDYSYDNSLKTKTKNKHKTNQPHLENTSSSAESVRQRLTIWYFIYPFSG